MQGRSSFANLPNGLLLKEWPPCVCIVVFAIFRGLICISSQVDLYLHVHQQLLQDEVGTGHQVGVLSPHKLGNAQQSLTQTHEENASQGGKISCIQ